MPRGRTTYAQLRNVTAGHADVHDAATGKYLGVVTRISYPHRAYDRGRMVIREETRWEARRPGEEATVSPKGTFGAHPTRAAAAEHLARHFRPQGES